MPEFDEPILPVTLSLNDHTGITLYAPPWQEPQEDEDGDEWQGFLGDGSKIVLLGTPDELSDWLVANPDHDLADHPAWPRFAELGQSALQPGENASYDFDAVYELAADEPSANTVADLGAIVDMAARIADCCEDGKLRSLLNGTAEYRRVIEDDADYAGKSGSNDWSRLGDVIADSWPRALTRLEAWLRFEGSSAIAAEHTAEADSDGPEADDQAD